MLYGMLLTIHWFLLLSHILVTLQQNTVTLDVHILNHK